MNDEDVETLSKEIAGLPSRIETDDIEARMFDLTALRMQLALAESDAGVFENCRKRVIEIASLLEEKDAIPAVKEQLAYLTAVQETEFWEGINLTILEDLRKRMRGLVQFIDKKKRKIVYSNFEDEVVGIRRGEPLLIPKMTGAQFAKKVTEYLKSHLDHIVIQKLRSNLPLTPTDLEELERMLKVIGEDEGERLLASLLAQSEAPSLPHFVRRLVGMDRAAAKKAFAAFLEDRSLSAPQIRFIELVIDQLTSRGVIEAAALYEPPFTDVNAGGPDEVFAGRDAVIDSIFEALEGTVPKFG